MEQQDKRTPLSQLMADAIQQVKLMADADTIIGTPIQAEGVTLIPVSRLSLGVAGGGTEFSTKKQAPGGDNGFGGGSGASAKLEPVAFLVIREGTVKLLPVAPGPMTTADRVIETVPEVVDKVTDFIQRQQEKKDQEPSKGDFAD